MSPHQLFRTFAIAETVTWTLLIAGLALRATLGLDIAVTIGGGIHGFVFLAYAVVAVLVAVNQRWSLPVTALAVASAVVPYATVPVDVWLARSGRLAGPWRTEASSSERWIDRLVRWFVSRPVLLVVIAAASVAAVFAALLVAGPPEPSEA